MLIVKDLTYKINHIENIFEKLSFTINDNEKIAIVGKNGIGKSILLKLLVNEVEPYSGEILNTFKNITYFPQKFNELNFNTISDVFNLENEVKALDNIENNIANVDDYENLNDTWDCKDYIKEQLKFFDLELDPLRSFSSLSGGEKVKVILSSIIKKNTDCLILDEPTNNMDYESKTFFYNFIKNFDKTLIVVSHDRELLNLVQKIYELRKVCMKETKLFVYGGNFDYFMQQKKLEEDSLQTQYNNSIKKINNQKNVIENTIKIINKKEKQGQKSLINTKNSPTAFGLKLSQAEKHQGKTKKYLNEKLNSLDNSANEIKNKIEIKNNIYYKFSNIKHKNKIMLEIENLNFSYKNKKIFKDFSLIVKSGDRIAINGKNGSGKSTLLKIINKNIDNYEGIVRLNTNNIGYLDQNYDLLDINKTILKNIQNINKNINEKDCRDLLAKFLFRTDAVYKKIADLSGGEKLRVALACIMQNEPELLMLDEPTNNMDLDSIEILENILNQYSGALIVVSHDKIFKENIKIEYQIEL